MQIDSTVYRIERSPYNTTFDDLVTSGAVRSGDVVWGEDDIVVIPYTPEPTAAEQWAITRRLITKDAAEEQTYINVENAIVASQAWRTGTAAGQANGIITSAQTIEGDTSFTTAERDTYIRNEAAGIRLLTQQLQLVMQRQEWLGNQMLQMMNR